MRRPLFVAGLSALGSVLLCMTLELPLFLAVAGALFAADLLFCILRKKEALRFLAVITAAGTLGALLFLVRAEWKTKPATVLCGGSADVSGTLVRPPETAENSVRLLLRDCTVNGVETDLSVTVYATDPPDAELWDTVAFSGVRFREAPATDVFFYHTLSGEGWLSGYARGGEVTAAYTGNSPLYRVAVLRQRADAALRTALPENAAAVASALLLGNSESLSADFRTQLRITGASHLFAVSGMHLALWAAVLFFLLGRRAKTKRWANAGASVFVLFYIALTGFSPSVLRAGIMLITLFTGRSLRKPADPLNSLGFAACILLAANPFLAGNVSFLLSFAAAAAILLLFPLFRQRRERRTAPRRFLSATGAAAVDAFALTFCILFFTVPVSGAFFGGVSLLSPVSSLFAALPAEGVMLTAAGGLLCRGLPRVSALLFRGCELCADAMETLLRRLSAADFLYLGVRETYIAVWYLATLAGLAAVLVFAKKKKRAAAEFLTLSAAVILIFGGVLRLVRADGTRVRLFDAGNAAVFCVETDGGRYLIGTGGAYEEARAAADGLTRAGVMQLDALILPDGGTPESGQAQYFADRYRPRQVFSAAGPVKAFPGAALCGGVFRLRMSDGCVYTNLNDGTVRAGLLESRTKLVFSYTPANDFSAYPTLQSGDCLVCRAGLPKGIDPAAFRRIFVLTDKSAAALSLPPNAVSLADAGDLELRT